MISKQKLDREKVPSELHPLIPLAEFWGIPDDLEREQAIENASPDQIAELKIVVERFDDGFDCWLAGSEAEGPGFSKEYIAFSSMRMAADSA